MCAQVTLEVFRNFVKCSILMLMKILARSILKLIRGNHRKCVCIIFVLSMTIIYLLLNCAIRNRTDCNVKKNSVNPVIVWWTLHFPGTKETKLCSGNTRCDIFSDMNVSNLYNVDAYLFYGSQIDVNNLPLKQPGDIWGLYHEESPRNLEELMHEPMLSLFNFSATFSRYSDAPFPLQYLNSIEDITSAKYFVPTSTKNEFLNDIAPVMYLQTDCETSTERDDYVKELMKFIKVDSYGACLNNKELPGQFQGDYLNNLNDDEFLHFVARYKFVIAIENGVCDDYVTEKFWRPIKVGVVPIYFGSPSIRDWFPNDKSAILLDDYRTPQILSDHLKKLLDNDTLYEEYLAHKTKKVITNSELIKEKQMRPNQNDGMVSVESLECLVCEKLHRKGDIEPNIVNKSHYNCPKPVSALTLSVNPSNHWVSSWEYAKTQAMKIKERVTNF